MFIPFENLSLEAKLWVYQAPRDFTPTELAYMTQILQAFVEKWETHQQPLQASFQLLHNRFIILAVEESYLAASGCSIDTSVAIIRQVSQHLGIDLFDRVMINYKTIDETWQATPMTAIKAKIAAHEFTNDTIIFNTLVQTKKELAENAFIKASNSWVKRYFITQNS